MRIQLAELGADSDRWELINAGVPIALGAYANLSKSVLVFLLFGRFFDKKASHKTL